MNCTVPAKPLTPAEERELGLRVRAGREAESRIRAGQALPGDRAALERGIAARNDLAAANLGWAWTKAGRTARVRGLDFDDCLSAAQAGMLEAAWYFDPDAGAGFCTYASYWMHKAISRDVLPHRTPVRLPYYLSDGRREPDARPEYLALAARWGKAIRIDGVSAAGKRAWSVPGRALAPDEEAMAQEEAEAAERALADASRILDERERRVLSLRYPRDGSRPMQLARVGKAVGLSRERVRQIEAGAIAKLRTAAGVAS